MSFIKRGNSKVRRSTSAPHHSAVSLPITTTSGTTSVSTASAIPPTNSSDEELPSAFFRSLKMNKGKSHTWSPEEEQQRTLLNLSSSSGEMKTAASLSSASSPAKSRRASTIFRKIGGGRLLLNASTSSLPSADSPPPSPPSDTTPPLWLPLVDFLCRAVEQHGVSKMGIFRLSANARTVRELLAACVALYEKKSSDEAMELLFAPYDGEVDVAASVLKAYLREQTQPLVPIPFHDHFVSVPGVDNMDQRLEQLAQLVRRLPDDLRKILERLIRCLNLIHTNQEVNRMDASNLAIVFAPSLLRGETEGLDIVKIRAQCQVIETFIVHHARIFTQTGEESSTRELRISDLVSIINNEDRKIKDEDYNEEEHEEVVKAERNEKPQVAEKKQSEFEAAVSKLTREAAADEGGDDEKKPKEHRWKKEIFNPFSPTPCQFCHKSIYGIRRKGYLCKDCHCPAHSKCRKMAGKTCSGKGPGVHQAAKGGAQDDHAPLVVLLESSCHPVRK